MGVALVPFVVWVIVQVPVEVFLVLTPLLVELQFRVNNWIKTGY